jgi:O-antigen/teichoic acid export membrane protein
MFTPIRLLQFFNISRQLSVLFYAFLLPFLNYSNDEIGSFELLQILAYSFSFFWISGLIQGLMHVYPSLPKQSKQKILAAAFLLFCVVSTFFVVLIGLGIYLNIPIFQSFKAIPFVWIFLLYFLINTPAQLLEYALFLEEKFQWLKISCLVSFPLQILLFSVPLLWFDNISLGITGLTLWAFFRFLVLIFYSFSFPFHFDKKLLYPMISYSKPLIFSALVGGLASVINASLVQYYYHGSSAIFAIYRYGARELPFVNGLFEGLGLGIIPSLIKDIEDGLFKLRKNTLHLLHLVFPISILLMFFVHSWFPMLFSNQFMDSIPIFKIFLFLVICRTIPTNSVINALGHSRILAVISLLELVIHLIASYMGLHWFGLIGIAYATFLAYSFEKLAGLYYLWRKKGIILTQLIPFYWWLFYSILLIVSYFINW